MKEWVSNNWIQHSLQQSNKHMVKFEELQTDATRHTTRNNTGCSKGP